MAVAADAMQQPQALFERSLEKLRITGCMGGLGASQRQRWRSRITAGWCTRRLRRPGRATRTVKAWVRRGLDRLKDCLEEAGVRRDSLA